MGGHAEPPGAHCDWVLSPWDRDNCRTKARGSTNFLCRITVASRPEETEKGLRGGGWRGVRAAWQEAEA